MNDDKKKPKQRHRLLVRTPEELGLTARIKKALLQQDMGITQRIKRVMDKTKDETSFLYMRKNHYVIIGALVFLLIILGYFAFRPRQVVLQIKYPNGKDVPLNFALSFLSDQHNLDMPDYRRQINYARGDVYDDDLQDEDFYVTQQNKKVENKRLLLPGNYTIHVRKAGYKEVDIPLVIDDTSISQTIKLEPIEEKTSNLVMYLNDPLLGEQEMQPDDVVIVKTGKSIKNTQVRKGHYVVRVFKKGYHPKETRVYVDADGKVDGKITLDYKKRAVKFLVHDGLSEEGEEPALQSEDYTLLKEGKKVAVVDNLLEPNIYDLVVERPGYAKFQTRIKVLPGEALYSHPLDLKPLPREVIIKPNYDRTPADIDPDKAYLKELFGVEKQVIPVTQGLKVAPGRYWVNVEKAGYYPSQKEVFITPGETPFAIKAHLIVDSQMVLLRINSDFDVEPIVHPDDIKALFDMTKKGYEPITGLSKNIPPEKKQVELNVDLVTKPRRVVTELKSESAIGIIQPDIVSLARIIEGEEGKAESVDQERKFKPGRYLLNISKVGYETINEEVIIYPDEVDYVIKRELKAYARQLIYQVDSDYEPGTFIKPDEILINREEAVARLKPGSYTLYLRKDGYHNIEQRIHVNPANEPFVIKGQFRAKPRRIRFDIYGGEGLGRIVPDSVLFDGNEIHQGDAVPPKKIYNIKVEKQGYTTENFTIAVEPSEEEYLLKKVLTPKTRPVIVAVTASFPPGELIPDKVTLNTELVKDDSAFKPGKYKLTIIKTGYVNIEKEVEIEPGEGPRRFQEQMRPRPRLLNLDIKYDVEPEDRKNLDLSVRVRRDEDGFEAALANGTNIDPNRYNLEIGANGYEKIGKMITISPSESSYLLTETLSASPRTVVFRMTGDWPKGQALQGYQVTLNGDIVESLAKIKPGKYALVIEKEGYHPLKEDISILAGTTDYIIEKQLSTKPRVINVVTVDAETGENIVPDIVTLGEIRVTGTNTFKPGRHQLQIKAQGYDTLTEEITIPAGSTAHQIERRLSPSFRAVKYELKGDFSKTALTPQEITLNGEPVVAGKKFRPIRYDLAIYVPGYQKVNEPLVIAPSKDEFVIKKNLISKPRKVVFNITGDYPADIKLKPDNVTFDNENLIEGEEVKPKGGGYQVTIEKAGYTTVSQNVVIEPSEEEFVLSLKLQARPRRLVLQIDSDYKPGVYMEIDEILVDGKPFQRGDKLPPGTHNITLKKAGFEPLTFDENIEADDSDYILKKQMVAKNRLVSAEVISDITGEIMEVEELLLGDMEIAEGEMFKPGSYQLSIVNLGYGEIRETIEVEPAEEPLALKRTLVALPRKVKVKVTFDVPPPADLPLHLIRVRNIKDSSFLRFQDGDELKPGEYRIRLEKEGYESYEERMLLYPGIQEHTVEVQMIARYVRILIDLKYDIKPPKGLKDYTVTFVDPKTKIGRYVTHGKQIKPGEYFLEIARPGYEFKTPRKKIYVKPGTADYYVKETLWAKARAISFRMLDASTGQKYPSYIKAEQVRIDNKVIKPTDTFSPGKKYNTIVKFKEFRTVAKEVNIPPGEGPHLVDVRLSKYKKYELKISKKYHNMVLDNVPFKLELFFDNEQLEQHHITPGEGFTLIYYHFYAPPEMRTLRAVAGFYYDDSLVRDSFEFRDLKKIDAERLIEHLRELAKGQSPIQVVRRLDTLLKDRQDKVKVRELKRADRETLANIVRDLPNGVGDSTKKKQIIKELLK